MTFIMNEFEIETAQLQAADDHNRPNMRRAVLTLARLMEWTNSNSDGWAYWTKPLKASVKLQTLVTSGYALHRQADRTTDLTASELKAAEAPVKAFLTRQGVDPRVVFINQ